MIMNTPSAIVSHVPPINELTAVLNLPVAKPAREEEAPRKPSLVQSIAKRFPRPVPWGINE